jgi:peptidoglycan/LPS O-acetylase OafA/YrhL
VRLFPGLRLWWATLACDLVLALACAALLWRFVERPVLRRKHALVAALAGAPPNGLGEARHAAGRAQRGGRGVHVPVRLEEQVVPRRI